MKKLRIGFLSTAGIGRKNWKAIFHSGNCVISAVASRDAQKSLKFIGECQSEFTFPETPQAFGSYEELIASSDVDAVYVPLPTALRKDWVLRAAAAGKHVLCEKPCAASLAELDDMVSACAQNHVQFMDGVYFMHSPRLAKIREVLEDDRSIGKMRRLVSNFCFAGDEFFLHNNIRLDAALEPAGCLGDLGWYSIRFALWAMNWQLPREVTGRILAQSSTAAPTEFSGELIYADGVSVGFYCSFLTTRQQWVHVSGDKGWLMLPGFVRPHNSYEPAFQVNDAEIRAVSDVGCPAGADPGEQGHPTSQEARMWRNFANQICSGKLNDDWPMWVTKTQIVSDACHEAARRGGPVKI